MPAERIEGGSAAGSGVRSDALVFFGATGDLAFRQIFPALAALIRDEDFDLPIVGVARRPAPMLERGDRWHNPAV